MTERTFYNTTIPAIKSTLASLKAVLAEGQTFAADHDEKAVLCSRLAPDMFPLWYQIYFVLIFQNPLFEQVAHLDPIAVPTDAVTTFAQLTIFVQKAIDSVDAIEAETYNRQVDSPITMTTPRIKVKHPRVESYVTDVCVPNLYFHLNMVYAILRMLGAPLGKAIYMGPFLSPEVARAWEDKENINPPGEM